MSEEGGREGGREGVLTVLMFESAVQVLAKPKSASLRCMGLSPVNSVLSSLRSRCAMWFLWQKSTASMNCWKK